jgi:D-lyxose ketol-isomerase
MHRFWIGRLASLWACSRELGGRAAEEPEYCEKLMYAQKGMTTPAHAHAKKKEDIICRWGKLAVQVWANKPALGENKAFGIPINHEEQSVSSGSVLELDAGWRGA